MEQTMFSIYQNKPAPTALELSLPWKQKKLQAQGESMDKCTGRNSSMDDPCCNDEVQLARHISTLSCSSPHCDVSPSHSPIHGEHKEELLLVHPEPSATSHIPPSPHPATSSFQPRTQHSHGVPKVFSMNDMDQGHFHLGVGDAPGLHASTNSCCGLTDISGISPPPSSSHLPWRDQQSSERPLRCSETHINCITANDIESHHRQCIHSTCVVGETNEPEIVGTPFWYCCESGLSRRRSMQSFQQTSMSSHHNLHDFPHHAHMHQLHHHHHHQQHHYHHLPHHHASNVCHASRKPFNLLGEDDVNIPTFSQLGNNPQETEQYFNQLENQVRAWFEKMDTEGINLGEEEEEKTGKCSMIVGGKEEEDEEYDFGSDARDMFRLNRCGSGTHRFIVESTSQSTSQLQTCSSPQTIAPVDPVGMYQISALSTGVSSLLCIDQPLQSTESFTDYSDSNQHTIHANPRV